MWLRIIKVVLAVVVWKVMTDRPAVAEWLAADEREWLETRLAEERRTIAEVSNWLPGFKARLGDAFPHETELEEKRAEMAELDALLAATANDAPGPESNAAA